MKEYVTDDDVNNEWQYSEFKRRGSQVNIDVRKHCICVRIHAGKEFRFFVERKNLIARLFNRILSLMMVCILICSKWLCPCHVSLSWRALTRLCWIDFDVEFDVELTSNEDHMLGIRTSLHDFEIVCRCMQGIEWSSNVLFDQSFAHYASSASAFMRIWGIWGC